jgi:hypothetical protein
MRRALDGAKPDGVLVMFLFHPPTRELFDRYARIGVTRPPW